jgi:hypothetical protein
VLLFLYQRENGDYTVNDLQLGSFRFVRDAAGREQALRNASELTGWDPDGNVHREGEREAEPFMNYIRGVVRGEKVAEDYFVATLPRAPETGRVKADALHPIANTLFTATSYTIAFTGGLGARWKVFPAAVNWNRGNSETGPLGNGAAEIGAAFAAWNAGGANYVLVSANANANGLMDPSDSINNIVFEKNLTASGAQPYSCTQGGVLGMGGIHFALFGGGTHVFHGETFGTALEGDVSMNQGVGTCTLAQFPSEVFKSTVTHEVGHTLGFRHSDQNRTLDAVCASDPSLDCSNSAIMNHIIVFGLNGHLQPWDVSALSNVYGAGPACTPPSISQQPFGSTITSGNAAPLSVTAGGTSVLTYQWYAGTSGNTSTPVNAGNSASILVSPAVTTSYWVRVTGACAPVADSAAATVTVNPAVCPLPQIIHQPDDQTAFLGGTVSLTVGYSGASVTVTWYQGAKGDTSTPIGTGQTIASPVLTRTTTQFWARIANACGPADSIAATITARLARRRAVQH